MELIVRLNPVAFSLVIPAIISACLAIYSLMRSSVAGSRIFSLIMLALCVWSVAYGLELSCLTLDGMLLFSALKYTAIAVVPVLWLILVLLYTGQDKWVTLRNVILLFIIPVITMVMVATNQLHYLFYSSVNVDNSGQFPMIVVTRGPWFLVHSLYCYVILFVVTVLLIQRLGKPGSVFRYQVIAMLVGMAVPWIVNILFLVFRLAPFGRLDLTPFAFTVTGAVVAWAIYRHGLFDVMPTDYATILNSIDDVIVVLDGQNRIVEFNKAAGDMLGLSKASIGLAADLVWKERPDLVSAGRLDEKDHIEIILSRFDSKRYYEASTYYIADWKRRPRRKVISLHDITDRKKAERELNQSSERYRNLFENAGSAVVIIDENGRYLMANSKAADSYGITPGEFIGRSIYNFLPQDKADRYLRYIRRLLETGKQREYEDTLVFPSGERAFMFIDTCLQDGSGRYFAIQSSGIDITDRKKAEQALQASEERYRMLTETMYDVVWTADTNLVFTYMSPAVFKMRGFTAEEVLRQDLDQVVTLGSIHRLLQELELKKDDLEKGLETSLTVEAEQYCKDGSTIWTESLIRPLYDNNRKHTGYIGVTRDIAERKQVEQELRDSEAKYRTLVDKANEAIMIIQDGVCVFSNRKMSGILGVPADELEGKSFIDFVWPEDKEFVLGNYLKRYEGKDVPDEYDFRITGAGQKMTWVFVSVAVVQWKGRMATLNLMTDITERKRAEMALQQSEEKSRLLIENSHDIIYTITTDGVFTFVSPAWTLLLGHPVDRVVGKSLLSFIHPDDMEKSMIAMAEGLRSGQPVKDFEYRVCHLDGSWRWHTTNVVPLKDEAGAVVGMEGISRDVTERKLMEQKLEEMATHDFLTGLPNRVLLLDRFTIAAALARRNKVRLAVMSLDLDKFKSINDTFGHDAGDQVLKVVGTRLTGIIRASDTLARVGGDEFVLVMMENDQVEDASAIAQKILDSFKGPLLIDGRHLDLSTSIGIAIYPEDGQDLDVLVKKSDAAMYYSKGHGRNRFKFFSDGDVEFE